MESNNIFDYLEFPSRKIRDKIRTEFFDIPQIKIKLKDPKERFGEVSFTADIFDYLDLQTLTNCSFNYSLEKVNIHYMQMINYLLHYSDNKYNDMQNQIYKELYRRYAEVVIYHICSTFEISFIVVNKAFLLKCDISKDDLRKSVIRELKRRNIEETKSTQELIRNTLESEKYDKLRKLRNSMVHSLDPSIRQPTEEYKNGVCFSGYSAEMKPEEISQIIKGALDELKTYSNELKKIIESYYLKTTCIATKI